MGPSRSLPDPDLLQRTLKQYAQGMASLAAMLAPVPGMGAADLPTLQQSLLAGYKDLFAAAAPAPIAGLQAAAAAADAAARYQSAVARWSELMTGIAGDAARRLLRALEEGSPPAPPISRLADLRALWFDCGEAAWGEAARRDEFAAAQAELLLAYAELGPPP